MHRLGDFRENIGIESDLIAAESVVRCPGAQGPARRRGAVVPAWRDKTFCRSILSRQEFSIDARLDFTTGLGHFPDHLPAVLLRNLDQSQLGEGSYAGRIG